MIERVLHGAMDFDSENFESAEIEDGEAAR